MAQPLSAKQAEPTPERDPCFKGIYWISYGGMKYSNLFGKTSKAAPHDADSVNARLLVQAGYIDQLMAGVYTFLPLGLRALDKVKTIIRDEMNGVGGQEVFMPALHPKENWVTTGRWDDPGPEVMFRVKGRGEKEYGLLIDVTY